LDTGRFADVFVWPDAGCVAPGKAAGEYRHTPLARAFEE
jgi:hypothetical protein